MISLSDTGIILGHDKGQPISVIPADPTQLPVQKPDSDILDMIDRHWFLKLSKRWGLNKKQIKILRSFYSQRATTEIDLQSDFKLTSAFHELETEVIRLLKKRYYGADIVPWFSGESFDGYTTGSIVAVGASGTGKTHMLSSILLREEYKSHDIYVFSCQNEDKSLKILNKRRKKPHIIDISKIDRPLTLDLFPKEGKKIVFIDDCLDVLPRHGEQGQIRMWLRDLITQVLQKGRHNDISAFVTFHDPKGAYDTKKIWQEAPNIIFFPKSGTHIVKDVLSTKLRIPKPIIDRALESAKGSRWLLFRTVAPNAILTQHSVMLI